MKIRPARKLIDASGKCAKEGSAYGQCVLASYSNMAPKACEKEFASFKACVSRNFKGKLW